MTANLILKNLMTHLSALSLLVSSTEGDILTAKWRENMSAIVYTKDFCPYCDMAKRLLKDKGVTFTEINITHAENPEQVLEEIRQLTTQKTFPQIVLDDKHIGGFTDLRDYYLKKQS